MVAQLLKNFPTYIYLNINECMEFGSMAQNGKFKEKIKHKSRPVTR
jgi:hypothetical protein